MTNTKPPLSNPQMWIYQSYWLNVEKAKSQKQKKRRKNNHIKQIGKIKHFYTIFRKRKAKVYDTQCAE